MSERRDLFGRTEAELVVEIANGERIYSISKAWTGNEGLAKDLARARTNLEVDKRQLAQLRGEPVDWGKEGPPRVLDGPALDRWRREFMAVGARRKA